MKKYEIIIIQSSVPIFILIFFISLIYNWTLGFTSFTTYAYVLNSAGSIPRKAPTLQLIDPAGHQIDINHLLQDRYALINFMYFRCPYVCSTTTAKLIDMYTQLKNSMPNKLVMISISIDKRHDTRNILHHAWIIYGKPKGWYFVSLISEITQELDANLQRFGVWAYMRPDGFFNHSTYLFLLDPNGNIIHVFNIEENNEEIIKMIHKVIS